MWSFLEEEKKRPTGVQMICLDNSLCFSGDLSFCSRIFEEGYNLGRRTTGFSLNNFEKKVNFSKYKRYVLTGSTLTIK